MLAVEGELFVPVMKETQQNSNVQSLDMSQTFDLY